MTATDDYLPADTRVMQRETWQAGEIVGHAKASRNSQTVYKICWHGETAYTLHSRSEFQPTAPNVVRLPVRLRLVADRPSDSEPAA